MARCLRRRAQLGRYDLVGQIDAVVVCALLAGLGVACGGDDNPVAPTTNRPPTAGLSINPSGTGMCGQPSGPPWLIG